MKKLLTTLVLLLLLVGCGGGETEPGTGAAPDGGDAAEGGPEYDIETGYIVNPEISIAQSGQPFVARGVTTSMNLTPRTSPEYLIRTDEGSIRYRIQGQSVEDTYYDDGTLVPLQSFQLGIRLQATVVFDSSSGQYTSDNITILRGE